MRVIADELGIDDCKMQRRQKQINETADKIIKIIVSKKMSYADAIETLNTAHEKIEEFTCPTFLNS